MATASARGRVEPGRTILLVEDEALVALGEQQTLEQAGYAVVVAPTGEKAVDIATAVPGVDLILMDINLGPGIDGPEAARRILAHRHVPLAFLSGHTEPEVVDRTEEITSYGYIVKGSGDTVLLASIRMAFRLFDAMQSLEQSRTMLATLLGVSSDLIETIDLQAIVQTASDQLARLSGLDGGAIYLIEGDSVVLRATTPKLPADFPDHLARAPMEDHPHIRRSIENRAPVWITDTAEEELTEREQEVVRLRGLRSVLYVPMVSRGEAIGVFITGSTRNPTLVARETIDLCVTLANIVAVAAENAMIRFGR